MGANIGTETISFADIVGPEGKVHAFEPLPSHAATLRRANGLSRHKNIAVHEFALSNEERVGEFIPPLGVHNGVGHLAWPSQLNDKNAIRINITTLDAMAEKIGIAKLIVTDMEGEEYNFLCGATDYIRKYRPYLLVEAAAPLLKFKGQSVQQQYAALVALGYKVFGITRIGLHRIADLTLIPDRQNWVCLPHEKQFLAKKVRKIIWQSGLSPLFWNLNPLRTVAKR